MWVEYGWSLDGSTPATVPVATIGQSVALDFGWRATMNGVQPIARIRLFGQFDLQVGDAQVPSLDSARAESLLGYLLLRRDAAQPRQQVAFVLWPDSGEAQARTNLRHVLHTLRRRLPDADGYLEVTSRTLRWRPDAPCWVDVSEFESLVGSPRTGGDDRLDALRAAVALYTGDLLEGCYDEWLIHERDRLRQEQLSALGELAGLCEARGALTEAIAYAERLLRAGDPLREETYRQLMRLYDASGDRARAVRVYHVCSSALERELGVQPSAKTQAAYSRLLGRSPAGRPEAVSRVGGPGLVGRVGEWDRLAAAWLSADAGQAQFVMVSGEPGIGKTRLVEEFRAWCVRRGVTAAEARCYPAEGTLAYGPVTMWLRGPALRRRLSRLEPARLTELARLLPELLEEMPGLARPEPLPEHDQRRRLFDAVAAVVLAGGGPVLLIADDLHHGDRETCQLVHYLLRIAPEARLLVLATARQEDIDDDHPMRRLLAGLLAQDRCAEIELARLSRAETAGLAERLTGGAVTGSSAQRLFDETEGNPLFVVEALRAGWTPRRPLSPRVQAVIQMRLAQLSSAARDLVGLAATIGREFSTDVLAAAAGQDGDLLVRGLDELWRRRIVREQSADTYDFSHDKIRQVAYADVTPARRRRLHLRIANALETVGGTGSAQIAAHYERAGAGGPAIGWYRRAAEEAQLLHANAQAVHLLGRSLALLRSLPGSPERDGTELAVQTALLAPLFAVQGYATPAVLAAQQRARELTRTLGADPTPPLLRSLALASLTKSDFAATTQFGQLLLAAGERDGDDVLIVEAAYVLGIAAFWQADFDAARRHFELSVERYRPEERRVHLIRYGQDPKVVCLSRLANTLWFLGRRAEARAARAGALAWAAEIEHPYSVAVARTFGALLALDMGDERELRAHVEALVAADPGPLQVQLPLAAFVGYLAVLDGDVTGGLAAIRVAVERASGQEAAPGVQAVTARILLAACVAGGTAGSVLAAAEELTDLGGAACVWQPDVLRVRARFALERG